MAKSKPRLVIGVQPVREVLRVHGTRVSRLMLQTNTARLAGLSKLATDIGLTPLEVPKTELDRVAGGLHHQGAIVEAPPLQLIPLQQLIEEEHPTIIALDGVQDPQNFGAVVRSAVGITRAPILWGENSSAPLTPTTFRASAGAIEHASLCRVPSLPQALTTCANANFSVVALDGHAERALHEHRLGQRSVLVIGGEGRGLSKATRRACTGFARLVERHTIDSLNASVAAALALYEAQRQGAGYSIDSIE